MNGKLSSEREPYVMIVAIVLPSIVTIVYFYLLHDFEPRLQQTAYAIGKSVQFLLPIVFVWFFDREFLTVSHDRNNSRGWCWFGLLFGLLVVAGIYTIYFAYLEGGSVAETLVKGARAKVTGMGVDSVWKYAALGGFYALVHSLLEEYYWRWFIFRYLKKSVSFFSANLISSLGFMAHHIFLLGFFLGWTQPLPYVFSLAIAIGGFVWAWIYDKTNSLLIPWISHLVVDAGIFSLGYFLVREIL